MTDTPHHIDGDARPFPSDPTIEGYVPAAGRWVEVEDESVEFPSAGNLVDGGSTTREFTTKLPATMPLTDEDLVMGEAARALLDLPPPRRSPRALRRIERERQQLIEDRITAMVQDKAGASDQRARGAAFWRGQSRNAPRPLPSENTCTR